MKHLMQHNLETWIHNQIQFWEDSKKEQVSQDRPRPFITISREYGCNVNPMVLELNRMLNEYEGSEEWHAYDKDLLKKIHEDRDVNEKLLETIDTQKRSEMSEMLRNMLTDYPPQVSAHIELIKTIRTLAFQGRKIIVGRAGTVVTRDLKYGLHLRMVAPLASRVKRVQELKDMRDHHEAEKFVKEQDQKRHEFMTQYVKFDPHNPVSYDLTINTERFDSKQTVSLIFGALKAKELI
jgi:cytidylate kinase